MQQPGPAWESNPGFSDYDSYSDSATQHVNKLMQMIKMHVCGMCVRMCYSDKQVLI